VNTTLTGELKKKKKKTGEKEDRRVDIQGGGGGGCFVGGLGGGGNEENDLFPVTQKGAMEKVLNIVINIRRTGGEKSIKNKLRLSI